MRIGNNALVRAYVGNAQVKRMYLGNTLVWNLHDALYDQNSPKIQIKGSEAAGSTTFANTGVLAGGSFISAGSVVAGEPGLVTSKPSTSVSMSHTALTGIIRGDLSNPLSISNTDHLVVMYTLSRVAAAAGAFFLHCTDLANTTTRITIVTATTSTGNGGIGILIRDALGNLVAPSSVKSVNNYFNGTDVRKLMVAIRLYYDVNQWKVELMIKSTTHPLESIIQTNVTPRNLTINRINIGGISTDSSTASAYAKHNMQDLNVYTGSSSQVPTREQILEIFDAGVL